MGGAVSAVRSVGRQARRSASQIKKEASRNKEHIKNYAIHPLYGQFTKAKDIVTPDAPDPVAPIDVVDTRTPATQSSTGKKVVGSNKQAVNNGTTDNSKTTKKTMKKKKTGLGSKSKTPKDSSLGM